MRNVSKLSGSLNDANESEQMISNETAPDSLLDDYVELADFAREVKRSTITVRRWTIREGLPFALLGRTVLIPRSGARDWLSSRTKRLEGTTA